jgi:C4-dicarboxylate-specific signal transduction histidine kinase
MSFLGKTKGDSEKKHRVLHQRLNAEEKRQREAKQRKTQRELKQTDRQTLTLMGRMSRAVGGLKLSRW